MKVLILGIDGYLGWSLAQYLAMRDHTIAGIDDFSRRTLVSDMNSDSAIPVADIFERSEAFEKVYKKELIFNMLNIADEYEELIYAIKKFEPDCIVHLAEQPSAPYSMKGHEECFSTQYNNILGTLNLLWIMREVAPDCHLLKLGTMGEYGTPNIKIPEGFFDIEYKGRKDTLPFPRQPGSFYHLTKVHDSFNIIFACKVWGIRSTDIMQGVVYGTKVARMNEHDDLHTRLDFDEAFGTCINRYCCQAVIGYPLSPFGIGHQRRGFLTLDDSMQCLTLAIENPPSKGEYRVFNQLEEVYDVTELAFKVKNACKDLGIDVTVNKIDNPRMELEEHFYEPDHNHLLTLGFKPVRTMEEELPLMLNDLIKYKKRIEKYKEAIKPKIHWR